MKLNKKDQSFISWKSLIFTLCRNLSFLVLKNRKMGLIMLFRARSRLIRIRGRRKRLGVKLVKLLTILIR